MQFLVVHKFLCIMGFNFLETPKTKDLCIMSSLTSSLIYLNKNNIRNESFNFFILNISNHF